MHAKLIINTGYYPTQRKKAKRRMPRKEPPDIEKLAANLDIKGLIKALTYEHDPMIGEVASRALIKLGKDARESNDERFFRIFDKYKNMKGKERRLKLESIYGSIYPEFYLGPRSTLVDQMLHPKDYKKSKDKAYKSRPLIIPKREE
jgi:hypothetical protein